MDRLLDDGYRDLIVADIAESALEVSRSRLAERGERVSWLVSDVRSLRLSPPVDVWHDRAVFHFLTEEADQASYLDAVRGSLGIGGHLVMATFALGGPERCSGLPVERYDPAKLSRRFGSDFELLRSIDKRHLTPSAAEQAFTYAVFQRRR